MQDSNQDFFRSKTYRFHQAVVLEYTFSKDSREWVGVIAEIIVALSLAVLLFDKAQTLIHRVLVTIPTNATLGVFLVALSFLLAIKMLNAYFNSFYFYTEGLLDRGLSGAQTPYSTPSYEICDIYYNTQKGDLLKSFCDSIYGRRIFSRIGISRQEVEQFLVGRVGMFVYEGHEEGLATVFTLLDLATFLVKNDQPFTRFMFERDIRRDDFFGAAEWVERSIKDERNRAHWWGKAALMKLPPIGADFAYGGAYLLEKYGDDISKKVEGGGVDFQLVYGSEEIKQLETILARDKEANAILVGEEGAGVMEIVLDFARDISNEYISPALRHKRVMVLNTKVLLATMHTKQDLEVLMLKIMNDVVMAGNIILVVENLPQFIRECTQIGSDVVALIDPYLGGDKIQFIGTASTPEFHQVIEPNNAIMKRFEKIVLEEPGEKPLLRIVERAVEKKEHSYPIYFTHQAVKELIHSARSYFDNAVMPDKAIDLLTEITALMATKHKVVVTKADVLAMVSQKTNIPLGDISADERKQLEDLEKRMKDLVVGQEEALVAIANAMRRSRAGVRNPNRPIGSFLFLGPTGVGKTETAKALATVFFGDEHAMSRLDMSEFQNEDGVARMIGPMGALSTVLKTRPYGVVLLDEFEKAHPGVRDLFLQLLDEGVIHNTDGKRINGQNSIFIATSNAGAMEIRDAVKSDTDLEVAKKSIVDGIIATGHMRPELLNRFDGIILFHPLTDADYRRIALLMLGKLKKRVYEKNIDLVINDALIDVVLKYGVDPDFGARPMVRAIQDIVEQKIADKIIAGSLRVGSTLEFTPEDFASL